MDTWDILILVVAAYIAVTALVRLMIRRRDQLVSRLRRQMDEEKLKNKHSKEEDSQDRAA